MKKKRKMHLLGTGHIWFGKAMVGTGYQRVTLSRNDGTPKRLQIGRLGAWNKVRLWVEVLE